MPVEALHLSCQEQGAVEHSHGYQAGRRPQRRDVHTRPRRDRLAHQHGDGCQTRPQAQRHEARHGREERHAQTAPRRFRRRAAMGDERER